MRKFVSVAAGLAALALVVTAYAPQSFAGPPEVQHGNGVAAVHNAAGSQAGSGNLTYHAGGSVQTGTHHTYAIYWGSSFSTNYKSIINGYFSNVAAASGSTSNVYYAGTQYYQTVSGVTTYVSYSEQFNGSW